MFGMMEMGMGMVMVVISDRYAADEQLGRRRSKRIKIKKQYQVLHEKPSPSND